MIDTEYLWRYAAARSFTWSTGHASAYEELPHLLAPFSRTLTLTNLLVRLPSTSLPYDPAIHSHSLFCTTPLTYSFRPFLNSYISIALSTTRAIANDGCSSRGCGCHSSLCWH